MTCTQVVNVVVCCMICGILITLELDNMDTPLSPIFQFYYRLDQSPKVNFLGIPVTEIFRGQMPLLFPTDSIKVLNASGYRVGRFKSMRFLSRFKSIDFFVKKIKWFKSCWWFHWPMKNYNKQKKMYCFIQLFDDWFYSHWFSNFNSAQHATHNAWEIFRNLGCILMLYSIIYTENRENTNSLEKIKKNDLNKKSVFFIKKSQFFPTLSG